jgi:hypothetical protein
MRKRRTVQTRLPDFDESEDDAVDSTKARKTVEPIGDLWLKRMKRGEEWGVVGLDDTVLLVQMIDGRIHAYGKEAVCKWCGSVLVIRDDKIFCGGTCRRYQGKFSNDPQTFLTWDGAKSFTLRRRVAEIEGLDLEERDLAPMVYASEWSVLDEYEDES